MAPYRACITAVGMLLALVLAAPVRAGYVETWNDAGAGPNDWYYFKAGAPNAGDVPLTWTAIGGVAPAPSGHVRSDLDDATTWTETGAGSYFLAYTYERHHAINLTLNPVVRIALRDDGGLDLNGGSLRFWVGEFDDPDGPGPVVPTYSFFYLDLPLIAGATDWLNNRIDTSAYAWVRFANQGGRPVGDLLGNPQQWGFGLFGAGDDPGGLLALDNFMPAPAPAPLALIALGLAGIGWTRRRARR